MNDENSVLGLATIRRNRGISLQQIAESTKIGVRALEAIERGDFHKLPGGIYTTSYIRQYAQAIDFDASAILALYRRGASASGAASPSGKDRNTPYRGFSPASTPAGS